MKMKPFDVKQAHILTLVEKLIIKILNLELVMLLKYQNVQIFLEKVIFQIGLKKFWRLKKLKTLFRGNMLLVILEEKKLLEFLRKRIAKNKSKGVWS